MNSSIQASVSHGARFALAVLLAGFLGNKVDALPLTQSNPLLVFQDVVEIGETLSAGQSVSGIFSIVDAGVGSTTIMGGYANAGETFSDRGGYVPATPLTIAKAYFYLRDANQGNDTVGLSLAGNQFFNSDAGSGNTYAILEGTVDVSLLQVNGQLSYSIAQQSLSRGSGFTIDYVQLQVITAVETRSVPDGGVTLALLLGGLVGLALLKRKITS